MFRWMLGSILSLALLVGSSSPVGAATADGNGKTKTTEVKKGGKKKGGKKKGKKKGKKGKKGHKKGKKGAKK
jgi:hypothetical protein